MSDKTHSLLEPPATTTPAMSQVKSAKLGFPVCEKKLFSIGKDGHDRNVISYLRNNPFVDQVLSLSLNEKELNLMEEGGPCHNNIKKIHVSYP